MTLVRVPTPRLGGLPIGRSSCVLAPARIPVALCSRHMQDEGLINGSQIAWIRCHYVQVALPCADGN